MTQDTKASKFTELTSVLYNDAVPFIYDPGGTPRTRRAPVNNFLAGKEITIVASDAPARWTKHADYICTGSNDDAQIALAIAAVGSASSMGGILQLSPGNFYFTAPLTFNSYQPLFFRGCGGRSTKLNFAFAANSACIIISSSASTRQLRFEGFYLSGDDTYTTYGIWCGANIAYASFFDIVIDDITDISFYTKYLSSQIYAEHVRAYFPVNEGFHIEANYSTWIGCQSQGGGTAVGFRVLAAGVCLVHPDCDSMNVGYDLPYTYDDSIIRHGSFCTLIAPYAEGCNTGMQFGIGGATHVLYPCSIAVIGGLMAMRAGATGTATVMIGRVHNLTITGLGVDTQIDIPSFNVAANATMVRLINCHPGYVSGGFPTTPYVIASGADVIIDDTTYYPTQNHGAKSVADGGTIAHGLLLAPTNVTLTGSVAGEIVTVTTLDATNLTVAIKKHDGTAGTTQTIYWRAEV